MISSTNLFDKTFLTFTQVASELAVSLDEVNHLVNSGKLPFVKTADKGTRVPAPALAAFKKRQSGDTTVSVFNEVTGETTTYASLDEYVVSAQKHVI